MNDSPANVVLACTAALAGGYALNQAEVISFIKEDGGKRIIGARIRGMYQVAGMCEGCCKLCGLEFRFVRLYSKLAEVVYFTIDMHFPDLYLALYFAHLVIWPPQLVIVLANVSYENADYSSKKSRYPATTIAAGREAPKPK
ncbi:hypothetical protein QVD17_17587 [Tagetes erecta]|uniref:Uncharacterized protein n=1 Tax=Tagetes erecta TaxID=13708 RepID=A0AAD8P1L2_TARER|nr:hypothetical protein QVD17_17587 [Tagetes erecta]